MWAFSAAVRARVRALWGVTRILRKPSGATEMPSTAVIAPRRCALSLLRSWDRSKGRRGSDISACPFDPHGTRLALSVARAANGPLLSGKGRAIAAQTECLHLAAISAHPTAVVGTGMPTLRGGTDNEAIAMPTAPSLERGA